MDVRGRGITPIMKRLTMLALALAALPLLAQEEAKKPASQAQEDSPLVAAARRSNRLGKKPAKVITNATLSKASGSTARVTTTETQPPILMPTTDKPRPTAEMLHLQRQKEARARAAAAEKLQKEAAERAERRAAAAAYRAEEGMYDDLEDPDYGEGEREHQRTQQESGKKPPQV